MIKDARAGNILLLNRRMYAVCRTEVYWGVAKLLWQEENRVDVLGGMIYLSSVANGEFYMGNGDVSQSLRARSFAGGGHC